MFYADASSLKPPVFKRLTSVSPDKFQAMSAALAEHLPTSGRRAKHCPEDRLLMTLIYWREYHTYAHIAHTYSLSESTVCRTIHTMENALLRSGSLTLPGEKALTKSDITFKAVVVDAIECPVERPKKSKNTRTAARKSGIIKRRRSLQTPKLDAS